MALLSGLRRLVSSMGLQPSITSSPAFDSLLLRGKGAVSRTFTVAAGGEQEGTGSSPTPSTGVKLFIRNLAFTITNDDLLNVFNQFGSCKEAVVIMDRYTGRSRGFGFIEVESMAAAEKAIKALDNTELGGRTVYVAISVPQPPRRDFRGGAGDRRNYRGGESRGAPRGEYGDSMGAPRGEYGSDN